MSLTFGNADSLVRQGAAGQALKNIRGQLSQATALSSGAAVEALTNLLASCFKKLKLDKLALASAALSQNSSDTEAVYKLGFQLVAAQMPDLAAAVLAYGLNIAPQEQRILLELSAALEIQGKYGEALGFLSRSGTNSFMPRYLMAFNTLMTGDIRSARERAAELTPATDAQIVMLERLTRVFARVDAVTGVTPLDVSDYRGWHFILTGGLLLHLPDPTEHQFGHYAYLEDSESLCKEGILRLAAVLEIWECGIPKILSFDNPESRRLGLAFAEVLGVPEKTVVMPDEPGLLVIYDQSSVIEEVLALLAKHSNDIRLFTHASQFSREYKVASDFTNLEYGSIISPWNRHIIFPPRPDLPTVPPTGRDTDLAHEVAASCVAPNQLADIQVLLNLAATAKGWAAGNMAAGRPREKHWHGRTGA